ncbi:MAG: DUF2384 domain-containing protein [Rhodocyclaceae bacterium]|nr:DUF2384 domain-containing protein [Rhodocyclaceae bacterium]
MSESLERFSRDPKQVGALLRMTFRLFEIWRLDAHQQAILLGVRSTSTVYRWRKHGAKRFSVDTLERIAHLLAIHKRLRLLFYRNPDLGKNWVRTNNKAFKGKPPIDAMLRGRISDLELVRRYLEYAAG